tara:strand:+ start:1451 stop:1570 length:120 start_codon:yes stop_codon:yes gene_type:complete
MHDFILPEETLSRLKNFGESPEAKNIPNYSLTASFPFKT